METEEAEDWGNFRCRKCQVPMAHIAPDSRGRERARWFCGYCEIPKKYYEEIYHSIIWAATLEELDQVGQVMIKSNIPRNLEEYQQLILAGIRKRRELNLIQEQPISQLTQLS